MSVVAVAEKKAHRLPFDERRYEEEMVCRLSRVVEREDSRMMQPGGDFDLAKEAIRFERLAQLGAKNFERDLALVVVIVGEKNNRHPSASQLAYDLVAAG